MLLTFLSLVPATDTLAHVGSAGVLMQKQAGKYRLLISIQPPDVVPGTAKVTVFVEAGRLRTIQARPIYFLSGDEGAPEPDALNPVGDNRFEGEVWLMASGSSSVELQLSGPDGHTTVVAPVVSVPTAMRPMPAGTGAGLAAMGLLLVVLFVTTIGASLSDGTVQPGQSIPLLLRRKRLIGMGIAALLLGLGLTGWRNWWTSWANTYQTEELYRPLPMQSRVVLTANRQPVLTLQIDSLNTPNNEDNQRDLNFLVPDHGKLMHAFVVRLPGLDAFAHLHPDRRDSTHFQSAWPALPAGSYVVYADVVYRNGFTETLTDTLQAPALPPTSAAATDADDSWLVTEPMGVRPNAVGIPHLDDDMILCGKPGASSRLEDGSTMLWTDKPSPVLEAGQPYVLTFAVADAQGKPAALEPYLGMSGHAAVVRSDASVYIHLHPVGTYSMAAEEYLSSRIADTTHLFRYPAPGAFRDSVDRYMAHLKQLPETRKNQLLQAAMPAMNHPMKSNNMVAFPYAFPRAGHYRIWVQVKRNGRVLTGVFDTQVKESLM